MKKTVEAPKPQVGRLAGFNVNDWANEYIPPEEVLDIKRGFDLFDHDGGGSIDPRGNITILNFQNSKLLLILLVSRPKQKQYMP